MVQVPIQTTPSVEPSGGGQMQTFAAPNVEPVKDFSGQQIAALGKAEEQLGNGMVRIANRIQSELDDANAANKANLAYEEIAKATNRYSLLSGKEAVDAKPAFEQSIKDIINKHSQGLENDTQKFIYTNKTNVFGMHSRINIDNHAIREVKKFDNEEKGATVQSYVLGMVQNYSTRDNITENGERVGPFATYENSAVKTFDDWANANGITKYNANGELTELYKKKLRESIYEPVATAITNQLHTQGQWTEAKAYLQQEYEKGNLSPEKYEGLLKQVETGDLHEKATNTARKLATGEDYSQSITYFNPTPSVNREVTGRFGDNRGTHLHGGIDTAAPVGTPIVPIANGTVTRRYNDQKGGGLSIEITHDDGSKSIYRHLGEFKAQIGQKVAGGEDVIGTVGMTGRTTGPHLHLEYFDAKGKKIDPDTLPIGVAVGGGNPVKVAKTPQEIQDTISAIENPILRQYTQSEYDRITKQQAAVDKQQDDNDWSKAMEIAWSGDGRQYGQIIQNDPELWGRLSPEKRALLIKGRPEASDPAVIHELNMNPNLAKLGVIEKYRPYLSAHDYDKYVEQFNGPQADKKLLAAHFDNNLLKVLYEKYDMTKYLHPSKDSPEERVANQIHLEITQRIDQEQRLNGNKELTPEQKEKVMRSVLTDKVKVTGLWDSEEFNWRLTKEEQASAYVEAKGVPKTRLAFIPAAARSAAQNILRSENIEITELNIARFYRQEYPMIVEAIESTGAKPTEAKIMEYYIRNKKRQERK